MNIMDIDKLENIRNTMKTISLVMIIFVLAQIFAGLFNFLPTPDYINSVLYGISTFSIVLIGSKYILKKNLELKLEDVGVVRPYISGQWIILGIIFPILITVIILLLDGEFIFNQKGFLGVVKILLADIFVLGLINGVTEELVFRGVIMKTLEKTWNKKTAIYGPSIAFGIMYALTGGELVEKVVYFFAGLMMSIAMSNIAMVNQSIWPSAFMRSMINIITTGNLISIATEYNENAIFSYVLENDSPLITGGANGVSYSLVAIIGYVVINAIAEYQMKTSKD